jgi:heme O synthase-like polyprenyltransferase
MGKKIALSTFYNLCIILCIVLAYTGYTNGHYAYILAAVFGGTIFIVLKIRLLKEVRKTYKGQ